jgi:hypothetical protein
MSLLSPPSATATSDLRVKFAKGLESQQPLPQYPGAFIEVLALVL